MADFMASTVQRESKDTENRSSSQLSSFIASLRKRLTSTSIITYLLFCVFGIGSWVAINGVWAELPILLITQPECFKLATILTLMFQVANIGPLTYSIVKIIWDRFRLKDLYLEVAGVFVILGIGVVSSLLLGIFWNHTTVIGGQSSSLSLYVLAFSLALVDCTSSVVFVPFMKHYPSQYMSALYIGEGLSGLLPSSVALIQGSVNNSLTCDSTKASSFTVSELGVLFGPNVFFSLLAVVMVICGFAFIGILVIPASRKELLERSEAVEKSTVEIDPADVEMVCFHKIITEESTFDQSPLLSEDDENEITSEEVATNVTDTMSAKQDYKLKMKLSTTHKLVYVLWKQRTPLLCLTVLSFLLNGAMPSISSFAYGSYNNLVLHLAINLGLLMNPLAALSFMLIPAQSHLLIVIFTSACCILGTYILINAFSYGVLVSGTAGGILIVSNIQLQEPCVLARLFLCNNVEIWVTTRDKQIKLQIL